MASVGTLNVTMEATVKVRAFIDVQPGDLIVLDKNGEATVGKKGDPATVGTVVGVEGSMATVRIGHEPRSGLSAYLDRMKDRINEQVSLGADVLGVSSAPSTSKQLTHSDLEEMAKLAKEYGLKRTNGVAFGYDTQYSDKVHEVERESYVNGTFKRQDGLAVFQGSKAAGMEPNRGQRAMYDDYTRQRYGNGGRELADSMRNVPEGFKVAAERFKVFGEKVDDAATAIGKAAEAMGAVMGNLTMMQIKTKGGWQQIGGVVDLTVHVERDPITTQDQHGQLHRMAHASSMRVSASLRYIVGDVGQEELLGHAMDNKMFKLALTAPQRLEADAFPTAVNTQHSIDGSQTMDIELRLNNPVHTEGNRTPEQEEEREILETTKRVEAMPRFRTVMVDAPCVVCGKPTPIVDEQGQHTHVTCNQMGAPS